MFQISEVAIDKYLCSYTPVAGSGLAEPPNDSGLRDPFLATGQALKVVGSRKEPGRLLHKSVCRWLNFEEQILSGRTTAFCPTKCHSATALAASGTETTQPQETAG